MSKPGDNSKPPIPVLANGETRRSRGRRLILCLGVAWGGIAIATFLSWLLMQHEQKLTDVLFRLEAGKRIATVQEATIERLNVVGTVGVFFAGSRLVECTEFHTFVGPLVKQHAGIEALAWVPRIPADRRNAHQQAVRNEGNPNYQITQRTPQGQFIPATQRDQYYPILFIEPSDSNVTLKGFDLASNPACRTAIERATTTRRRAAVVCCPLNGSESDHSLLYVVEPAWNEDPQPDKRPPDQPEIDGFVLGVFRVCTIVDKALSMYAPVGIDISIWGSAGPGGKIPLYTRLSPLANTESIEHAATAPEPPAREMHLSGTIQVADISATIDCVPTEFYLERRRTLGPLITLVAGLVITALLVGYLILLTGRTTRVERLVAERTQALRASEQRFRRLVDNASDAFFLHDMQGNVLDVSQRACDSLGYTRNELLSMNIAELDVCFAPRKLDRFWGLPVDEYPVSFEGIQCRKDGSRFPVEIRLTALDVGGQRLILGLARDITDRKQLEQTLHEGNRKLRAILDQSFQFIGMLTPEGILTAANKTALAFSGVSEADVLNKPFWETPWWTHSSQLQDELRLAVKRAAQGDFVRMEVTHLAANGDLHWIDFSLKPVKDEAGTVIFLIPEGRDITDRKRTEEALREEQRLLRDMLDLHERDRKLMAYEIHDGLAQQLTGALYKFQTAEQLHATNGEAAIEACEEGTRLLREAMAETRRLIGGLRPPVLDELGIVAAIEYMVAERRQEGGPEIEFVAHTGIERLAPPLESALFRIAQECLTNACRYSQSKKVRVELSRDNGCIRIDVQDWGVGFDVTQVQEGHFGLRGIRERARLLGGKVAIHSAPHKGAQVTVDLPRILPAENGTTLNGKGTSDIRR